jgi:hypothetical protein
MTPLTIRLKADLACGGRKPLEPFSVSIRLGQRSIGEIKGTLISVERACSAQLSIVEEGEKVSWSDSDVVKAIFDDENNFRPFIWKRFRVRLGDVLAIHVVRLDKRHRGRGWGLEAVKTLVDYFEPSLCFAALYPCPLGGDPYGDIDNISKKLASHWGRLGFRKIPRSHIHLLEISSRTSLKSQ